MPKCHKCQADFSEFEETCPYCGTGIGIESITEIMEESRAGSAGIKKGKKEKKPKTKFSLKRKKRKDGCTCSECGTPMYDNSEICPKCGYTPSVETITSILDKTKGE